MNFSISWYPDLKALYSHTLETQLEALEKARTESLKAEKKGGKGGRDKKQRPRDTLFDSDGRRKAQTPVDVIKPMFLVAHELYDALPIHQFKYLGSK